MRHKRLIGVLTSLVLVGGLFGAAAPAALATNPYNCTDGSGSRGYTWYRHDGSGQWGINSNLLGVKLNIVARAMEPCWGNDVSDESKNYLLASLEGTIRGNFNFPQIGLCKFRNLVGGNWIDQTEWCVMPPGWQGSPVVGPNWIDFDGNGVNDNPVGGRTYTVQVQLLNDIEPPNENHWIWRYKFTDTVLDVSVSKDYDAVGQSELNQYSSNSMDGEAWWGCEAGPNKNRLITEDGDPVARMSMAGYKRSSDGAWLYTQDSVPSKPPAWNNNPASFKYDQDQNGPNDTDRVWCWSDTSLE